MKKLLFTFLMFSISLALSAGTLEDVKAKGVLTCGVSTGLAGFSAVNSSGVMEGLDADTCRAVAAAVFGDGNKVQFVPLTAKERFTALASGEIDLLVRNTTWTLVRDASLGLNFAGVNYYDGQGFLVAKSLHAKSPKDLNGASFCIQAGTTTELNLAGYFQSKGMSYQAITFDSSSQTKDAFAAGRCDVLTSDTSQLASIRSQLTDPSKYEILSTVISKEPLGPVVRQGDDVWFNIVKWSLISLLDAEELGITSNNINRLSITSKNPSILKFLGKSGNLGKLLGLKQNWSKNIIKAVGNYSEMFNRNVGPNTPLGLSRGINALWTNGGIMYGPPMH